MVAYIVESSKGYFKAFVAHTVESEGDNDSTLFVLASGGKSEKLEEVQEFLRTNVPNDVEKTFLNPIKSNESGLTWLSELERVNPEI